MHSGYKQLFSFQGRCNIKLYVHRFLILFLLFEIAEGGGILLAITVVTLIVTMILTYIIVI